MAEIKSLKALVSLLILMLIYISYSPNAFGAWSLVAFMNSIRGIFWLFIRQTLSVSTAVFCIAQTVLVFVFWVDSWSAICFYIFFINTSLSFLSKKKGHKKLIYWGPTRAFLWFCLQRCLKICQIQMTSEVMIKNQYCFSKLARTTLLPTFFFISFCFFKSF